MKTLPWLRSTAIWLSLAYGLFFAAGLPLLWWDWWNLPAHLALFGVSLLPFVTNDLRRRTRSLESKNPNSRGATALLLASVALGCFLQRHSIYHYYATHDPAAYLSSAQHLARSGSLFHHDDLLKRAFRDGEKELIPLLAVRESSEPWHQTKNYGVLPKDLHQGLSTFHGLFGAPLFLAASIKALGPNQFLKIQWVHFAVCVLLLAALVAHFLPHRPYLTAFFTLFFSASPLVTYVFREPLSEPLAAVFFLSLLTGLTFFAKNPKVASTVLVLSLVGALGTRVSGLFYIPGLLVACAFLPTARKRDRAWLAATLILASAIGLAFMFKFSSTYASDTLIFYTTLAQKIAAPRLIVLFTVVTGVVLGVLMASQGRIVSFIRRHATPQTWRRIWYTGFSFWVLAVTIRYFRLATVLDHNIGGYPFVLFNLDSLIFYGSPAVILFGLAVWIHKLGQKPLSDFAFLQIFLPFVLFFYGAFRFMPLNTQPNFQRYLVIELLPLAILGFSIGAESLLKHKRRTWLTGLVTLGLGWNGLLLASINHNGISSEGRTYYGSIDQKLKGLEAKGKKPVLAVVAADWVEMSFMQPLSSAFDHRVTYLREPFSEEASRALDRLILDGYTPLLVVPSRLLLTRLAPTEPHRRWERSDQWQGCYDYPKFGFGAPPQELSRNCTDFTVFHSVAQQAEARRTVRPAWYYRSRGPRPERIWDWFGLEVYGPAICKRSDNPKVEIEMLFDPERTFVAPQLKLNGTAAGSMQVLPSGQGKTKRATQVLLSLDASDFSCADWNSVDVTIPPGPGQVRRTVSLLDARFEGRSLFEPEDAMRFIP